MKVLLHRGADPQVYFWRTAAGSEVDFVIEANGKLIPVEAKLSATPRPPMAAGIAAFQQDLGEKAGDGYVVHSGEIRLPLWERVTAVPFGEL